MSADHVQVNVQIKHVTPEKSKRVNIVNHSYRIFEDGYIMDAGSTPFGSPLRPLCTKCDPRFERSPPKHDELMERFSTLTGYSPPPAPKKARRIVPCPVKPNYDITPIPECAKDPDWIDQLIAEDFRVNELGYTLPDIRHALDSVYIGSRSL